MPRPQMAGSSGCVTETHAVILSAGDDLPAFDPSRRKFRRVSLRLPIGARERVLALLHLPDDLREQRGEAAYGRILRDWVMERLAQEESGGTGGTPAPALDQVTADLIARATALLTDPCPEVRDRFIKRILLSEDDRRRPGRWNRP